MRRRRKSGAESESPTTGGGRSIIAVATTAKLIRHERRAIASLGAQPKQAHFLPRPRGDTNGWLLCGYRRRLHPTRKPYREHIELPRCPVLLPSNTKARLSSGPLSYQCHKNSTDQFPP